MNKSSRESLQNTLKNYIEAIDVPSKEVLMERLCERLQQGAFISFAQNYEDVILNRIFRLKEKGFYVDVGAFHPIEKSVTCHFSKRGWTGMNVDICNENISRFEKHRPLDLNICAAIGSKDGIEEFFVQRGTTRTTKDKSLAESYEKRGVKLESQQLNVYTLSGLLSRNNIKKIDFLSVDVEGAEIDVFQGINFDLHRPTVILAEATYPETDIPNWEGWEPILEAAGYFCVYFDGLNRFYIESDNTILIDYFKIPPNYFDNFIRHDSIVNLISGWE
ncbi:FkbM family methyltransferase [Methylophaga sp.]|uniref:FkbM family methyltransferase n=1 Tax=Methylophaga sp. TaxID=2024840 RepID=UPI0025DFF1D0|nr:FkbM family methyltransferase [Methylophaga sp.]